MDGTRTVDDLASDLNAVLAAAEPGAAGEEAAKARRRRASAGERGAEPQAARGAGSSRRLRLRLDPGPWPRLWRRLAGGTLMEGAQGANTAAAGAPWRTVAACRRAAADVRCRAGLVGAARPVGRRLCRHESSAARTRRSAPPPVLTRWPSASGVSRKLTRCVTGSRRGGWRRRRDRRSEASSCRIRAAEASSGSPLCRPNIARPRSPDAAKGSGYTCRTPRPCGRRPGTNAVPNRDPTAPCRTR